MRKLLRQARKDKGLTQQQLADLLGVKLITYKRIEYGQRIGRIETWDKLEDIFGIHQRLL